MPIADTTSDWLKMKWLAASSATNEIQGDDGHYDDVKFTPGLQFTQREEHRKEHGDEPCPKRTKSPADDSNIRTNVLKMVPYH